MSSSRLSIRHICLSSLAFVAYSCCTSFGVDFEDSSSISNETKYTIIAVLAAIGLGIIAGIVIAGILFFVWKKVLPAFALYIRAYKARKTYRAGLKKAQLHDLEAADVEDHANITLPPHDVKQAADVLDVEQSPADAESVDEEDEESPETPDEAADEAPESPAEPAVVPLSPELETTPDNSGEEPVVAEPERPLTLEPEIDPVPVPESVEMHSMPASEDSLSDEDLAAEELDAVDEAGLSPAIPADASGNDSDSSEDWASCYTAPTEFSE
ncbi:Prokaryotic membrane lipoprotein lipid attachment site [Carpediemonas membranifera]|uniref:Prokaryotic membrane lipoprotein lipid attachment site n=1 Tax=Carpediemonas membranifera TaxID=201153 RepID=A0A8J6B182_9EUKA|nr:Prokaryotic membrane lipoprotein lipid attachment site [Carpediemonas membranifera]|eukprot:KAG9396270.1 Prokaryotic membrane lipoprotein lipid attachment site [Carpediemonas membranifera]